MNDDLSNIVIRGMCRFSFFDLENDMFLFLSPRNIAEWVYFDSAFKVVNLFVVKCSINVTIEDVMADTSIVNTYLHRYEALPRLEERKEHVVMVPMDAVLNPRFDLIGML